MKNLIIILLCIYSCNAQSKKNALDVVADGKLIEAIPIKYILSSKDTVIFLTEMYRNRYGTNKTTYIPQAYIKKDSVISSVYFWYADALDSPQEAYKLMRENLKTSSPEKNTQESIAWIKTYIEPYTNKKGRKP